MTLFIADVDGGKPRQLRPEITHSLYSGAWTPDGRTLAYVDLTRTTGFDIIATSLLSVSASATASASAPAVTPILRSPANETAPAFSPDGRWLAFVSDVTGAEQVYLVPFAASSSATSGSAQTATATAATATARANRRDRRGRRRSASRSSVRRARAGLDPRRPRAGVVEARRRTLLPPGREPAGRARGGRRRPAAHVRAGHAVQR